MSLMIIISSYRSFNDSLSRCKRLRCNLLLLLVIDDRSGIGAGIGLDFHLTRRNGVRAVNVVVTLLLLCKKCQLEELFNKMIDRNILYL